MENNEVFDSQIGPDGRYAGVYEHDEEVGYFYFYDLRRPGGQKIVGAIRIAQGPFMYSVADLSIRWSSDGRFVGLFIAEGLVAAFDAANVVSFGGSLELDRPSQIPVTVRSAFAD